MPIDLYPLSLPHLHALAAGGVPDSPAGRVVDGALTPQFVAGRSLAQLAAGKPAHWCSPFAPVRRADGAVVGG